MDNNPTGFFLLEKLGHHYNVMIGNGVFNTIAVKVGDTTFSHPSYLKPAHLQEVHHELVRPMTGPFFTGRRDFPGFSTSQQGKSIGSAPIVSHISIQMRRKLSDKKLVEVNYFAIVSHFHKQKWG
jgi:hypothetical protein